MKKNRIVHNILFMFSCFIATCSFGITIDRAILATTCNPFYMDFWPVVAKAWNQMGVRPTLALIEDRTGVQIDESLGDVIRFKPIKGVSPGWMSMVIRLFLPAYFENEICIISDIDILPLNKTFFIDSVAQYPDDSFIVYRKGAYKGIKRIPMCYVAAKGKLFKEIFKLSTVEDIPAIIQDWAVEHKQKLSTDEVMLATYLQAWPGYNTRCVQLEDKINEHTRIDRSNWVYDKRLLKQQDYYIDSHMVRPYHVYKKEIDELASCIDVQMPQEHFDKETMVYMAIVIVFSILFILFFIILLGIALRRLQKKRGDYD